MGNNPSTPTASGPSSKPQTPVSAESSSSPRPSRRDFYRSPIPVGHTTYGLAAPPAPSNANALAYGSSVPNRPIFGYLQHQSQYQPPYQYYNTHAQSSGSVGSTSPAQSPPFGHNNSIASTFATRPTPDYGSGFASTPRAAPGPVPSRDAAKPVDVPHSTNAPEHDSQHDAGGTSLPPGPSDLAAAMLPNNSISDMSYLTRPPCLPLPIEEELKTPGSPIAGPTEVDEIIDDEGDILSPKGVAVVKNEGTIVEELLDTMTRKSSATTTDDDIAGSWGAADTTKRPTVPTRLQWRQGGDKVWVTGTIFQWKKKHRLRPVEGQPGCFADTINIVTGTHHLRFLVDGVMQTSQHLPTTVDLANNLVNYIVVTENNGHGNKKTGVSAAGEEAEAESDEEQAKRPKTRPVLPSHQYLNRIPPYLADFDQSEESPVYHYAASAIDKLPTPPSLPGFLAKPLLNAPMVVREDNSVLILPPNHTVLNHLATSSIKNNILAVSATTRYRSKYVTTIMYKPSTMDE